jgi:hypothetical protein
VSRSTYLALLFGALCASCKKDSSTEDPFAMFDAAMFAIPTPPTDFMPSSASEQFGTQFSCPKDRVEAKRRPDLDPSNAVPVTQPPDEVKSDPGRLAKWNADQDKRRSLKSDQQVFEVTGCGHTQLLNCRPHHAHGAVYDYADCAEIKPSKL